MRGLFYSGHLNAFMYAISTSKFAGLDRKSPSVFLLNGMVKHAVATWCGRMSSNKPFSIINCSACLGCSVNSAMAR